MKALTAVSSAVVLCVLLVDRPLALWLDARFRGTAVFDVGATILRPLDALLVVGAVLVAASWAWRRLRAAPAWVDTVIACGAGVTLALLATLFLKLVIGRSQVAPLFLHDHVYTFRPFAGARDFMAFPSATMSGVGACLAAIGSGRAYRWVVTGSIMTVLAFALLATNGHWLADIIGGAYLGLLIGSAVAERFLRAP